MTSCGLYDHQTKLRIKDARSAFSRAAQAVGVTARYLPLLPASSSARSISADAIAVYDDVVERFGIASEQPLRELIARVESYRRQLQKS